MKTVMKRETRETIYFEDGHFDEKVTLKTTPVIECDYRTSDKCNVKICEGDLDDYEKRTRQQGLFECAICKKNACYWCRHDNFKKFYISGITQEEYDDDVIAFSLCNECIESNNGAKAIVKTFNGLRELETTINIYKQNVASELEKLNIIKSSDEYMYMP